MSSKFRFLLIGILLLAGTVTAQKGNGVSEALLNDALAFAEQIEEKDLIAVQRSITVSFERSNSGLKTVHKERYSLMNPENATRMDFPLFYDDESEITEFKIYNKNGSEDRSKRTKITDTYLENEELFHTDYRVKQCELAFLLPQTVQTVVSEKVYRDPKYFTSIYFSAPLAVFKGELKIFTPDWLELEIITKNFEGYKITEQQSTQKGQNVKTYTFSELEAQADEGNSLGPSYLYPHVLFVIKSYTKSNGDKVPLINSLDDLYGWYSSLATAVDQNTEQFMGFVSELTKDSTSDLEKIESIYYWVQDNIRYIAFEDGIAGFQPATPADVFEKRYGDCKGMAILTKTLLRTAGFDARLVWLGTDRLAYDYSIPSLAVDNHMICALNLDGSFIFLDGTEKFNRYGEYAGRILGREVLIEGADAATFERYKLPATNTGRNADLFSYELSISESSLVGSATRSLAGESRASLQYRLSKNGSDDREQLLERFLANGNRNVDIANLQQPSLFDRDSDLSFSFDVSIDQAVSEFEGVYYVDLNFLGPLLPNQFLERKTPFYFQLFEQQQVDILLKLPEGKTLAEQPQDFTTSNPLLELSLTFNTDAEGNLVVSRKIVPKKRIIEPKESLIWDMTMSRYKEALSQQITLE